jgi:glycerophosphoryl diester phosphodiesterase
MVDVYAHRGFHLNELENSLGAFAAAVALGVTGVERDVRRTSDGVLVISHDPHIGALAIASSRYQELADRVATLDQAMDTLRGVRVNVEIKNDQGPSEAADDSGDLARQVVSYLQDSKWTNDCIISSFDLATCQRVHDFDPTQRVGWLFWDVEPLRAIGEAHDAGLQAIHPHFLLVSAPVVAAATANGLDVNVWTVNDANDMTAMASLGVASIITDDPTLALRLLG